ncbi:hypothetical protein TorRG33x02_119480 [Trema orientale]|uniref:Uncharacterized protein n=1 Tax=Trema orientale TaxID=63057 RepID=A0A2P5F3K0_TREOI|nr:hypothetical protein TorRG33x02_119480 [Trema orientale]
MASHSNSSSLGISSSGSLDIILGSLLSPLPTPILHRVDQTSVNNLQAQKIATLEANLRMVETNLMEAYEEIDRRSCVIPVPVLTSHAEPQPPFYGAKPSTG